MCVGERGKKESKRERDKDKEREREREREKESERERVRQREREKKRFSIPCIRYGCEIFHIAVNRMSIMTLIFWKIISS